jgi:hypothetical protein
MCKLFYAYSTRINTQLVFDEIFQSKLSFLMLNTVCFGLLHCIHYNQEFHMKGIDTYFAALELWPINQRDRKALIPSFRRQLLYMFGTIYHINILKLRPKFQAIIRVPCWVVAAPDRQTHTRTFLYYTDKTSTEQNTFYSRGCVTKFICF